jgi:hypothetical protein
MGARTGESCRAGRSRRQKEVSRRHRAALPRNRSQRRTNRRPSRRTRRNGPLGRSGRSPQVESNSCTRRRNASAIEPSPGSAFGWLNRRTPGEHMDRRAHCHMRRRGRLRRPPLARSGSGANHHLRCMRAVTPRTRIAMTSVHPHPRRERLLVAVLGRPNKG